MTRDEERDINELAQALGNSAALQRFVERRCLEGALTTAQAAWTAEEAWEAVWGRSVERALYESPLLEGFEPVPPADQVIEDADLQFAHLVYVCAVLRGAQPTVDECWPVQHVQMWGRRGGKSRLAATPEELVEQYPAKQLLHRVQAEFFESVPPASDEPDE